MLLGLSFESKAESTIVLKWTQPAAGETYSTAASEGDVSFLFDGIISDLAVSNIYIVLPSGEKVEVVDYSFSDAFYTIYSCHIGSQMAALYGENKIRQGDEFKVRLEGLRRTETNEVYGTDGVCEVSLLMGTLPTELVSTSVAWEGTIPAFSKVDPASDEGKVTFTFSDPVSLEKVTYGTGGVEDGTRKEIEIPFTVNGSDVVVNFQGIALDPASLGVDAQYTSGTIKLHEVKRVSDGTYVKGAQGSEGSVTLFVNVSETISESIYGGIDNACNIDTDEQLVIYATEEFIFDAIEFDYTVEGTPVKVALPGSKFSGAAVADGYEYYIPIADFSFDAGDVSVSVVNPRSLYNQSFTFQSWTFTSAGRKAAAPKVLSAEPAEGAVVASMPLVSLVFNEAVSIESAELFNADTQRTYQLHEMTGASIQTLATQVSVNTGLNEYGHMTLKLRAKNAGGAYVTYGDADGYATLNFHVRRNGLRLASSVPADGVEVDALQEIKLLLESTTAGDVVGGFARDAKARLLTLQGEEVATGSLSTDPANYLGVVVTLDSTVVAAGTYVLTIDEKVIFNNGYNPDDENYGVGLEGWEALYNDPISIRYVVTGKGTVGIDAILMDVDGNAPVYNLAGVPVGKAGHLEALPSGIYLLAGRKVIVK